MQRAYSHQVSSAGSWPGGADGASYSYAYPEPAGFRAAPVASGAAFDDALREFVLGYHAGRQSQDPDSVLLAFLDSTYAAAADLRAWDRSSLEAQS
jgi:Family of unknown function (DUF5996)